MIPDDVRAFLEQTTAINMDRADDNMLVTLILETREAVENLESIAAVPGVDAIFLGPADSAWPAGSTS